ncbi:MAG: AMP-binding protein [Gammaproteobacteria bacterium]|nr:AMP-binding protein [Gammaproteobacteria bacterium]
MDTFPSLFQQQVRTRNADPAIRVKRLGLWHSWTWGDTSSIVENCVYGLASKGLESGEKVAIIGNNIPELYLAMVAVQCLGAVPVPVHPDSNTEELVSTLNNCEAKVAVVQDQQQVDALYNVIDRCKNLGELIYHDGRGMQDYDHSHLSSFEELQEAGKKFGAEHPGFFEDITSKVTQDSEAFVLYTSGTSGEERGAVHTHGSMIITGKAVVEQERIRETEEVLAFMPISYAASLLFTYTLWLLKGFTVNCPESNETCMNDLREIGPTILYAPPHFYKQLYAEIIARSQRSSTRVFRMWFGVARANREKFLETGGISGIDNFKFKLGTILMFAPLKNVYGLSKLRKAFTGGDIMSSEVFNFYRSIGLHLKKTYGTAESAGFICIQGPAQINSPSGEFIMGSPLPGVEVKLLDDGEIAFRGVNSFKEYYGHPNATAAAKDAEGWVHTGDLGEIDEQGGITITGRVDALGKFSSGETFAPQLVENALKSSPYIKDAIAVGEAKDSIAAFLVIDGDTVGSWAEANNIRFTGYRDLATKDEVYDLVSKTVSDVNSHIEQIEGKSCPPIKRYLIMHREFNVEAGEITRSRKIRRDVVMGRHKALVDSLYSSQKAYEVTDATSGEILARIKLKSA